MDIDILKKYGSLDIIEFDYLRFKSNNNGLSNKTKYIQEQLYILSKYWWYHEVILVVLKNKAILGSITNRLFKVQLL